VDTFLSPDEHAAIQVVTYDDGAALSQTVSGDFVLSLLQEKYTNDLYVLSDTLRNGREQLVWIAFYSDYQGVTIFETQNTTLLMVTVMWENDFNEVYQGMLERVIESYSADGLRRD
jgi:hypothetical protein